MKLEIIDEFTEGILNMNEKTFKQTETKLKPSQKEMLTFISNYISKVKNLFYDDLSKWGNRIVDVLITELQTKYELSYEKAEYHVLNCLDDNKIPKPIRAKYNYNICREMGEYKEVQIIL